MPPKTKAAAKPKEPEAKQPPPPPSTVNEQSRQRFELLLPYDKARREGGLSALSPAERTAWTVSHFVGSDSAKRLSAKAQRDLWKQANEANLPLRTLREPRPFAWAKDRSGRDVGEYSPQQFAGRTEKRLKLTALEVQHSAWLERRDRAQRKAVNPDTQEVEVVTAEDVEEERRRRKEMAALKEELYGVRSNPYEEDPEWDDVVPVKSEEGEGALAAIAYSENYAEAISYLRAVMANREQSARCLKLTEHVISMNPAHYTVWLYRFSIITALGLSIPDEMEWLDEVTAEHLKNYQIWHHRHLLMEAHHPTIAGSPEALARLRSSESHFLTVMLAEDTKNYHVWSYRQYLTRRLAMWTPAELSSIQALIDEDVRNNSAWSHRFFLVFSDPAHSTPGSHATEHDPAVPAAIVDREVRYAQDKIALAPQNQSPWNYLRGVLVKGGRNLATAEDFASQFVAHVGQGDSEVVKSSHALDLLAEIYAEKGDKQKADLCLCRLGEKWDRIRAGYWEWRRRMLLTEGA